MSITGDTRRQRRPAKLEWSLSVVSPVFNEAPCIAPLVHALRTALSSVTERWEILFVDDHSNDDTLVNIRQQNDHDPRVQWIRLARRQGQHTALACGMDLASGDAVVTMDADLQHPPAHLPEMIERWLEGYDIVNMVKARSGLRGFSNVVEALTAGLFYRVFNLISEVRITPAISEYRLLDRSCIEAMSTAPERYRYPKGVIPQLDCRQYQIEFKCARRQHGRSGYTLGRRVSVASQALAAFNSWRLFATLMLVGALMLVAMPALYSVQGLGIGGGPGLQWASHLVGFVVGLPILGVGALGLYATIRNREVRPPRPVESSLDIALPGEKPTTPTPVREREPQASVT